MFPLLSENEKYSNLYTHYYPINANELDKQGEETFKYRQAKGALNEIEKHVKQTNEYMKKRLEEYANQASADGELAKIVSNFKHLKTDNDIEFVKMYQNGQILLNAEIKSALLEMQKEMPKTIRYHQAECSFYSIEMANCTLNEMAKSAFDTIEMVKEEEKETKKYQCTIQ